MKKRSGVGFGEKIETRFALEGTRICFYVVVPLDFQTLLAERRNKESRLCLRPSNLPSCMAICPELTPGNSGS